LPTSQIDRRRIAFSSADRDRKKRARSELEKVVSGTDTETFRVDIAEAGKLAARRSEAGREALNVRAHKRDGAQSCDYGLEIMGLRSSSVRRRWGGLRARHDFTAAPSREARMDDEARTESRNQSTEAEREAAARRLAEQIIDDFRGAGFYADPKVLADLLKPRTAEGGLDADPDAQRKDDEAAAIEVIRLVLREYAKKNDIRESVLDSLTSSLKGRVGR
jgi:hypothetical protein